MKNIKELLERDIFDSAIYIFNQVGIENIKKVSDPNIKLSENSQAAIVGISGESITGTLILSCDKVFLEKTYPLKSADKEINNNSLNDWFGELSNLLAGHFKAKLYDKLNMSFNMVTPMIMDDAETIMTMHSNLPEYIIKKFFYVYEEQYICLQLGITVKNT